MLTGLSAANRSVGIAQTDEPRVVLAVDSKGKPFAFDLINLPAESLRPLSSLAPNDASFGMYLQVWSLDYDSAPRPARVLATPMLGTYTVVESALRFLPRFPLSPGMRYEVIYRRDLSDRKSSKQTELFVPIAETKLKQAVVERICPSASVLPENQLRFYVHFSEPMSRGDSYRHLDLLDAAGNPIPLAFLEIGEELWDPSGRRLTLLIDPGRIKRGLKPREDVGPVLENGKAYCVLIRSSFETATGQKLATEFRKPFRAGPPVEERVDVSRWHIVAPKLNTNAPLAVDFPRPLDRALLERMLWIVDSAGKTISGKVAVADQEKRWEFRPDSPWKAGSYQLVVDTTLEDQAGNNVAKAFEVDENLPIEQAIPKDTASLPFTVSANLKPADDADEFATRRLANWHHWRGPNANGTAPNADPPTSWGIDKNVRWKMPLEGRGSATPIVWDNQVFVVTAIDTGRPAKSSELPKIDPKRTKNTTAPTTVHQFVVSSFDRDSGKRNWRKIAAERVPHEGHHSTHSYAAGSPTTDGERLYVSFGSFGVFCFTLEGQLLWHRDFGLLNTRLGWGEAVTPVVHAGSLLLNWDQEVNSRLICLDAKSGQTKWETKRDEPSTWTTPLVVTHEGVTQIILNGTNRIRSYEMLTGAELWQSGGMSLNSIPSPVADREFVYVMCGYRSFAARAIRLDARGDVTQGSNVAWQYNKGTPYVPSPLLMDNRLYFTQANNALLTVLNAKTGKPMLDRIRLPGQSAFYASPIVAGGRVYLVDRSGTTLVLRQADKFEVLATNKLDDPMDASPVAVGKQLFFRGERFLYCVETGHSPGG